MWICQIGILILFVRVICRDTSLCSKRKLRYYICTVLLINLILNTLITLNIGLLNYFLTAGWPLLFNRNCSIRRFIILWFYNYFLNWRLITIWLSVGGHSLLLSRLTAEGRRGWRGFIGSCWRVLRSCDLRVSWVKAFWDINYFHFSLLRLLSVIGHIRCTTILIRALFSHIQPCFLIISSHLRLRHRLVRFCYVKHLLFLILLGQ